MERVQPIHWAKVVGGAILISIACIDPGNLQGDIEVSQKMGYKSIWVLLSAHILLYFFQEMAIMVGSQSSLCLGRLIRRNYSWPTALFLWFTAELAIIAADVQEILGSAIALNLLFGLPMMASLPIVIVVVMLVLLVQQSSQRKMEFVFLAFVSLLSLCFCANLIMMKPDIGQVLNGFIPNVPTSLEFTAVVGATIMPQNLFLHASLVHTRLELKIGNSRLARLMKVETGVVLIISFAINFAIVTTFANPYYADKSIDLANAGTFLTNFLPSVSAKLWAVGLLCSGISSTATGALTGQYLMEGIFDMRVSKIKRVFITRLITLIPCVLIVQLDGVNRLITLFNIVQFVQLPLVVIPLLRFISSRPIMGRRVYSTAKLSILAFLSLMMQLISLFSIYEGIKDYSRSATTIFLIIAPAQTLYLIYLIIVPIAHARAPDVPLEDRLEGDEVEGDGEESAKLRRTPENEPVVVPTN